MKKFKKVVPALCALLVSAVMLGSSTYAWFSMNTKVTAKGMSVTATSSSTYLVISENSTVGTETSLDLKAVKGSLLPVSYTTSPIQNAAASSTLVAANKWFTAVGTDTTNGTAQTDSKKQLNITENNNFGSADTNNYYVIKSFYIGLVAGSSAVTKGIQADVKFSANQKSDINQCLTVKIVYGENDDPTDAGTTQTFVYGAATGEVTKYSAALQENGLINTTNATKVTVYIYFDGENENCTTAKAINLDLITVDLTFTVNEDLHPQK